MLMSTSNTFNQNEIDLEGLFSSNFAIVSTIKVIIIFDNYFIFIYLFAFVALCSLILFFFKLPSKNLTNNRLKFPVFKLIGRLFSLKLILYGTREDPLTNNTHVDRRKKRLTKFTKDQVKNRRKGQL